MKRYIHAATEVDYKSAQNIYFNQFRDWVSNEIYPLISSVTERPKFSTNPRRSIEICSSICAVIPIASWWKRFVSKRAAEESFVSRPEFTILLRIWWDDNTLVKGFEFKVTVNMLSALKNLIFPGCFYDVDTVEPTDFQCNLVHKILIALPSARGYSNSAGESDSIEDWYTDSNHKIYVKDPYDSENADAGQYNITEILNRRNKIDTWFSNWAQDIEIIANIFNKVQTVRPEDIECWLPEKRMGIGEILDDINIYEYRLGTLSYEDVLDAFTRAEFTMDDCPNSTSPDTWKAILDAIAAGEIDSIEPAVDAEQWLREQEPESTEQALALLEGFSDDGRFDCIVTIAGEEFELEDDRGCSIYYKHKWIAHV